jgi:membrane protease YdiL (CAAX protease family)
MAPQQVTKTQLIKNITIYSTYIIVIWGFYRFLFQFPEQIEELVIKPILWLAPILYLVIQKERLKLSSLGFTFKNLFPAVYFSIGLGAIFVIEGLITNYLKYGGVNFAANIGNLPLMTSLGLSFATSFSEETAFRGYVFNRLWLVLKNEWLANIVSTLLWTGIHVPIAFFVWKLSISAGLVYLGLTTIFGLGSAFIFARTKNVWGSIFLHVLWEWPIILFR